MIKDIDINLWLIKYMIHPIWQTDLQHPLHYFNVLARPDLTFFFLYLFMVEAATFFVVFRSVTECLPLDSTQVQTDRSRAASLTWDSYRQQIFKKVAAGYCESDVDMEQLVNSLIFSEA